MNKNITQNKDILGGKPVIKGTRISVDLIVKYITNGDTIDDIKRNFPQLSNSDIKSALDYSVQKQQTQMVKLEPARQ